MYRTRVHTKIKKKKDDDDAPRYYISRIEIQNLTNHLHYVFDNSIARKVSC